MSNVFIDSTYMTGIANAIRTKSGTQDTYLPSEMPSAINNIPSGSSIPAYPLNNSKNNIWIVIDTPNQSVSITVGTSGDTVNWGDGTTDTNTTHTYSDIGIYCITSDSLRSVTDNSIVLYAEYNLPVTTPSYQNSTVKKVTLNNSNYTSISANQFNTSPLKEISMPYVTSIGDSAFENTRLTSVIIPSNVTLGTSAFANNTSLTTLTLNGDRNWSSTATTSLYFNGCSNLTTLNLNGVLTLSSTDTNIPKTLTTATISSGVTSIGTYCFKDQTNLTSVTIPSSVTSIGNGAFCNTKITSVNVPNAVIIGGTAGAFQNCTSLTSAIVGELNGSTGGYAFAGCTALTTATINGGTNILRNSFQNCTSLTTVNLPNTITTISTAAFSGCTSLTQAISSTNITSIGNGAFYNTKITSVNVPNAVILPGTSSSRGAFQNCTALTSAIVGELDGNTTGYAFYECIILTTATINGGTNIPRYSFGGCTSLTTVNLPNTIISINGAAFSDCTSLTNITIPASVRGISQQAFYNCTSMQEYHFLPTAPPTLENTNTFENIPNNCIIYVPAESVEAYQTANYWSTYASYIQAEPSN